MLVLSFRRGERVFIGDNICVTVTHIDGGKVRLGVDCPFAVPIAREAIVPPDDPRRTACVTHTSTATVRKSKCG